MIQDRKDGLEARLRTFTREELIAQLDLELTNITQTLEHIAFYKGPWRIEEMAPLFTMHTHIRKAAKELTDIAQIPLPEPEQIPLRQPDIS